MIIGYYTTEAQRATASADRAARIAAKRAGVQARLDRLAQLQQTEPATVNVYDFDDSERYDD